jgi:threonine synthase
MFFRSNRNNIIVKSLSDAIRCGLAEDGGLFVPEYFAQFDWKNLDGKLDYALFAEQVLREFFVDDELEAKLPALCKNAFSFPVPLKQLKRNRFILELFHGATLSFKDFGARFLAECLESISMTQQLTIMVATSGDTGSAVASAFYQKRNIRVIILYPKGQISKRQEQQIICWDKNVLPLSITGTFDHCQQLVKEAFTHPWWQNYMHLSSANSINIGRLLPQITYYAYSSVQFYQQYHVEPGFIIPSGNLGNATAAYWAKAMGFPIREIVLATNANRVIENYLHTGSYTPQASVPTLANAMDVGNPSNFERLKDLFRTFDLFKDNVTAYSVDDEDIRKTIKNVYEQYGTLICPHTATAYFVSQQVSDQPWIIVATAHPGKFDNILESITGEKIPIPLQLTVLLDEPANVLNVSANLENIKAMACRYFDL